MYDTGKTRMIGLPLWLKNCDDPFSSDTGTLLTDGRTTDRQICYINIARQYMLTRAKNLLNFVDVYRLQ